MEITSPAATKTLRETFQANDLRQHLFSLALLVKSVWSVVKRKTTPTFTDTRAADEANRTTIVALNLMLLSMSANYYHAIADCEDASDNVLHHCNEALNINTKLNTIGAKMEEEDVVIICLLRSLPKRYDNGVLNLEVRATGLKMNVVIKVLTNEPIKRQGENTAPVKLKARLPRSVLSPPPAVTPTAETGARRWINGVNDDYIELAVPVECGLSTGNHFVDTWAFDNGATRIKSCDKEVGMDLDAVLVSKWFR
ncbi:hypothetical protein PHYSODRAFT_329070 [Phytophthora sojae]|uniref:Uncharacterized protein n=1 Tax=Phytophthora sojae (strain P6497) TaxID=1094619 RepID=G4Z6X6_PHYSP|nr:hypothetical protein PHYSODRAFT_329070 [Phytophthora sojae]EGZ21030.1 hypothetical protein PHYSODRAFT_329070 [Phytophthora sojae]|eukprot:XP_009523747.1 hypothetical protein PHYSODRAFT_329070 [Phytophthora sojae]